MHVSFYLSEIYLLQIEPTLREMEVLRSPSQMCIYRSFDR